MNHLTPDELADACDGALSGARGAHLAACPSCRAQVAELSSVIADIQRVAIPEPSPLLWDHLSSRVRESIADESTSSTPGWAPRWLRWPVLVPMAALALLVLSLSSVVSRVPSTVDVPTVASSVPTEHPAAAGEEEGTWAMVSALVGPLDIETAQEAGIAATLGSAEDVALQLTALEQAELVRLLQQELDRAGS
jgi:hypothetical protein